MNPVAGYVVISGIASVLNFRFKATEEGFGFANPFGLRQYGNWWRNKSVHLSGIEQSLLYLLAGNAGRIVAREDILDGIWGKDFVAESNVVDRHVRSLRVKLRDDYRHPRFIATVPAQGYRFLPTFSNAGWRGGHD